MADLDNADVDKKADATSRVVSMTGHGEGSEEFDQGSVSVEIRSVNHRYLKSSIRLPDGWNSLESKVDDLLKKKIRRGSVAVNVSIRRRSDAEQVHINKDILQAYLRQLAEAVPQASGQCQTPELLLTLPGVIDDPSSVDEDLDRIWESVQAALAKALDGMQEMRAVEGLAMAADLRRNCQAILDSLKLVEERAPKVVENFQQRITERLNSILERHDVSVEPNDVIREVGLFADRCDISEEIVRLKSHLDQFESVLAQAEGAGKKLDFITQEMFRETNTIGSKANDAEIARHVVEMKAAVERIREMTQNIE